MTCHFRWNPVILDIQFRQQTPTQMTPRICFVLATTCALLLSNCASGPSFTETQSSLPKLTAGKGRLFIYRTTALGAAIQPAIKVNGNEVGKAKARGFVYADLPAGAHTVETRTEVTRSTSAPVTAGQPTYVRLNVTMGLLAARVTPEVVPAATGAQEIAQCKLAK